MAASRAWGPRTSRSWAAACRRTGRAYRRCGRFYALCNATIRYALQIANHGVVDAVEANPEILSAINIHRGKVAHAAVADTFGLPFHPFA